MPQLSGSQRGCCCHCTNPSASATSGFGVLPPPPARTGVISSDFWLHFHIYLTLSYVKPRE